MENNKRTTTFSVNCFSRNKKQITHQWPSKMSFSRNNTCIVRHVTIHRHLPTVCTYKNLHVSGPWLVTRQKDGSEGPFVFLFFFFHDTLQRAHCSIFNCNARFLFTVSLANKSTSYKRQGVFDPLGKYDSPIPNSGYLKGRPNDTADVSYTGRDVKAESCSRLPASCVCVHKYQTTPVIVFATGFPRLYYSIDSSSM